MIIKILENSPELTGFLASQPFARVERDELRGTVFTENGDEPNLPLSKRLDSLRSLRGLSGVDLIVLDEP